MVEDVVEFGRGDFQTAGDGSDWYSLVGKLDGHDNEFGSNIQFDEGLFFFAGKIEGHVDHQSWNWGNLARERVPVKGVEGERKWAAERHTSNGGVVDDHSRTRTPAAQCETRAVGVKR